MVKPQVGRYGAGWATAGVSDELGAIAKAALTEGGNDSPACGCFDR